MKSAAPIYLASLLVCTCPFCHNAFSQTARQPAKATLAPITINLDDDSVPRSSSDKAEMPKDQSTPSAKDSVPGPNATEAGKKNYDYVINFLKESKISLSDDSQLNKIAAILAEHIAEMSSPIESWRSVALQISEAKGITPDFASKQNLDDRIELHKSFKQKSTVVVAGVITNFRNLENELIDQGISKEDAKQVNAIIARRFKSLVDRMTLADKLADTGLQALDILKNEWGNFSYNDKTGLKFETGFSAEEKQKFSSLVGQYKQILDKMKDSGGFE